jgi:hypothetical protein
MNDHWLSDWIENRPWWVKWLFGFGPGVVLAFLPDLLCLSWQRIAVANGATLIAISLLGGAWQAVNEWRLMSAFGREADIGRAWQNVLMTQS